ncbi:MAG: DUF1553 domain-containing protein [bacterium]|nr:DUF1553 domain-containing protein [bacterium]
MTRMKWIGGIAVSLVSVWIVSAFADELSANQRALEAAKVAQQAVKQAEAAQQAVNQAVDAARSAANQANELARQAYLAIQAEKRKARVAEMPAPPQPPETDRPVNNDIDRFIVSKWSKDDAPELCDDETFLRRAFLDVVGYIPKPSEVEAFVSDPDPAKRSKWIDSLLARDDDYAANWTQFWEDALCSNGNHQGGVGTRANFQPFIIESFKTNKPYDVFVQQILDPKAFGYSGGYVKSETHLDSLQTAANVGQVFLGTRMKCASCHDNFINFEWPQKRFLGFASFFSDHDLEVIRCEVKKGEFIKPAFIFDNGKAAGAEKETLEDRLHDVAGLITDPENPRFAASFVNRLWKRSLGLGLVEPVDDFREDTPPSNPELLQWLSYEFAASGYDVKHMMRLILNSRTYQLRFDPELADRYMKGLELARLYRSPSHRRLTCEQALDSVAVAMGLDRKRVSFDETSNELTRSLGRPETRNEVITTRPEDVAVIQSLQLMNSPDFHKMIYDSPLPKELARQDEPKEALREAYLRVLNREPRGEESEQLIAMLGDAPTPDEWGDLLWALTVSPQFQYIH